ncbi:hypothetical protein [Zobellia laminariae]|uniref:hypothetical protein n=1 Tax=Zobellia laminariae TaxID=248906 RepID=UPI0026F472D9|nr:hypothetical protein [Zobellia laminariae]WKX74705.1 hypothetical protein Q5W13_12895 [Zobellia laminariae]
MINYEQKYSVSEIAKILETNKLQLKKWTYHFKEYLSPNANPEKGIKREFTIEDVSTLGYISMYWEEEPDFENIKYGLNSNEQFESPYNKLAIETIPIFRQFSKDLIGGKVWTIGGITEINDKLSLADSYKFAGDSLVNIGIENVEIREIIYPTIYNYRHATELYLKVILPNETGHDLKKLYNKVKILLKNKFDVIPPKWFENIINAFHDFDPGGTTFRYGIKIDNDEMFIDLIHLQKMMKWFSESIHQIEKRLIFIE